MVNITNYIASWKFDPWTRKSESGSEFRIHIGKMNADPDLEVKLNGTVYYYADPDPGVKCMRSSTQNIEFLYVLGLRFYL